MSACEYRGLADDEWQHLNEIFPEPVLRWTKAGDCTLDGRKYDRVPLLLDIKGRVVDAPTSWFLHLTVSESAPKTVAQYAYALRIFWAFLGTTPWTSCDNTLLREWRNDMVAKGIGGQRANDCIDAVVAFCRWAQDEGLTSGLVGATPEGGQPYPIRLVPGKGRRGKLVTNVRERAKRPPRLPVPDIEEMDQLYQRLTGPDEALSERNCLMADMAVECGLRREEIVSLNKGDLASYGTIAELRRMGKVARIEVTGKGNKARIVPVLPELMEKLQEHIRFHRKKLLGKTTRVEEAVFLSKKTGRRLTVWSVSRLFTKAFGSSNVQKLSLHRLRARYASLVVLTLARSEMRTRGLDEIRETFILRAAADVLGHSDITTLSRYVDLAIRTLKAEVAGKAAPTDTLGVDAEVLAEVAHQNAGMHRSSKKPALSDSAKLARITKSL